MLATDQFIEADSLIHVVEHVFSIAGNGKHDGEEETLLAVLGQLGEHLSEFVIHFIDLAAIPSDTGTDLGQ